MDWYEAVVVAPTDPAAILGPDHDPGRRAASSAAAGSSTDP